MSSLSSDIRARFASYLQFGALALALSIGAGIAISSGAPPRVAALTAVLITIAFSVAPRARPAQAFTPAVQPATRAPTTVFGMNGLELSSGFQAIQVAATIVICTTPAAGQLQSVTGSALKQAVTIVQVGRDE